VYDVFLVERKNEENRKNKHRGDLRDINTKELGAARIGCPATIDRHHELTTSTKLPPS